MTLLAFMREDDEKDIINLLRMICHDVHSVLPRWSRVRDVRKLIQTIVRDNQVVQIGVDPAARREIRFNTDANKATLLGGMRWPPSAGE